MEIRRRYVTVSETPEGWVATEEGREPQTFPAAAEAQKAIKKRSEDLAEITGVTFATYVTWDPTTPIGRSVVKVLTEK